MFYILCTPASLKIAKKYMFNGIRKLSEKLTKKCVLGT